MYEEPKKRRSAIIPATPGKPNPGCLISANRPNTPTIINIVDTTGLFRNLTVSSAQFVCTSITFAPDKLNAFNTSSRLFTRVSAIPYFKASSVVSVISCVLSTNPGTTILSSTIPWQMLTGLPFFSATLLICPRIND